MIGACVVATTVVDDLSRHTPIVGENYVRVHAPPDASDKSRRRKNILNKLHFNLSQRLLYGNLHYLLLTHKNSLCAYVYQR